MKLPQLENGDSFKDGEETFGMLARVEKERNQVETKFRNPDLEKNTNAIQEEFDNLMQEMLNNRKDRDAEGFYNVMDQYYGRGEKD